ncbi:MAG: UDP-2,3-diacylglucosamine diphosphatase [Blastopirellula sp. JB062]
MIRETMKNSRVRTLFISDVHLGCRYARVEPLLDLLNRHDPEYVYIVGDFIDGWRLRKRWHWEPIYNAILSRLFDMSEAGSRICYAPGNHDDFLRDFRFNFGFVEIADEFIHRCPRGRRFLVTHGDKFDQVESKAKWLSVCGSFAYDSLCWLNQRINHWLRYFKMRSLPLAAMVKKRVKAAVTFVSDFETNLVNHARDLQCNGVVCGHIHTPALDQRDDITYCNTGDWIENATALVEYEDGRLEIVDMQHEESEVAIEDSSEFVLEQGKILRNMLLGSGQPAPAGV